MIKIMNVLVDKVSWEVTHYSSINIVQFLRFRDGQDLQLGGCLRDFRNRPNPVRLKIRYYEKVLTVSVSVFFKCSGKLYHWFKLYF